MSAKQELQELEASLAAVEEESTRLHFEAIQLRERRKLALLRHVVEAKLLAGTVWQMRTKRRGLKHHSPSIS